MAIINALGQDGGTGTQVLMSNGGATAPTFQGVGNGAMDFIAGSTYSTLQEMNDLFHSAGMLVAGNVISDGGSGTVDLTEIHVAIRPTDDATDTLSFATVAASTGVALTNNDLNYIYIEYNSGTPQYAITVTERTDYNTNVLVGTVYRDSTTLHITNQAGILIGDHASLMVRRMQETNTFARVSGEITSETGTRNIAITTGIFWEGLTRFTIASFDSSAAGTFSYFYRDGVGGWTEVTAQTQVDNTQYDDNSGTLATLTGSRYGVHWVYRGVDGDTYILYGQGNYTLSQAVDAGSPSSTPPHFEGHALLIAKIIIQNSASTFHDLSTPFDTVLTTTGVTDHGELAGLGDDDHCFSEDTELLTENGFIPYEEIEKGQKALTLNLETNDLEYNEIQEKYVYDSFDELISFKNRYGEILVTPQHTMIYRNTCKEEKNPKSKWLTCTAEEAIDKSVFEVPVSGFLEGETFEKPNEFFELLGLIISEGNFCDPKRQGYGIRIYQKDNQADYIEDLLKKLDVPYTRRTGQTEVFYIRSAWARENLRTWITEKRISNKLMQLRGKQFRAFLSGLIYGDGSKRSTIEITKEDACRRLIDNFDGQVRYSYHTGDIVLKDQLCQLCTFNGLKSYDYYREGGFKNGCWTINITNKEKVLFGKGTKSRVDYSGNVWCVSVPNKTLVLRRNGFIFIAGNTQYLLADGTRALAGAWDMGSQALTNVNIDSGTINGITDLAVADGGTGASDAPTALSNLGGIGAATTDTLTNKTFDANGTGNSLSNVDVADLANGTDGELITWDAAGAPATVSAGTATHVLTSNGAGAAPTFQAAAGGAWEYISTTTASSSATIDLSISSTYDILYLVMRNVVPASDGVDGRFIVSTDGGSTYDTSAGDYARTGFYSNASSISVFYNASTTEMRVVNGGGNQALEANTGGFYLFNFNNSGTGYATIRGSLIGGATDGAFTETQTSNIRLDTGDYDAIRFLFSSGNIASGDFILYGLKTS